MLCCCQFFECFRHERCMPSSQVQVTFSCHAVVLWWAQSPSASCVRVPHILPVPALGFLWLCLFDRAS